MMADLVHSPSRPMNGNNTGRLKNAIKLWRLSTSSIKNERPIYVGVPGGVFPPFFSGGGLSQNRIIYDQSTACEQVQSPLYRSDIFVKG
mmetsp:Transcript_15850/g.34143  ORF Transcript_15850/g.34143 Transcript_15850/m.34143 type:complete len:89 (-) Transcript_15850:89-355(-)